MSYTAARSKCEKNFNCDYLQFSVRDDGGQDWRGFVSQIRARPTALITICFPLLEKFGGERHSVTLADWKAPVVCIVLPAGLKET